MFTQRLSILLALCALYALEAAAVDCDKPPKKIDLKQCCAMPDWVTPEIEAKCKDHIKQDKNIGNPMGRFKPCFMSCFFNETGIYVNNELNEDKVTAYFGNILKATPEFMPITQTAFKKCAAKQKEMKAKWEEMKKNRSTAAPAGDAAMDNKRPRRHECMAAMFLGGCVFKETFTNCPADIWQDSDDCNAVRDHMINCKFMKRGRGKGPNSNEMPAPEEV